MLVVALGVYALSTVPGLRSHAGYSVGWDGWLQNSVLMAAAAVVGLRACIVRDKRLDWACIAVGLGLYAVGNIIYFAYVQYQASPPAPSAADVPWLVCYPFLYVGVIRLARQPGARIDRLLRIDSVISALGLSAIAMIWFEVMLRGTSGSLATVLTTMAYPVGDLLLMLIVVGCLAVHRWRVDRVWAWLGAGLGLFAAADTIYAIRVATDSYRAGTLLDPMWAVAATMMAIAAWKSQGRSGSSRENGWAVLYVPTLITVTALALLVLAGHGPGSLPVRILAAATVLAGLVRAAFTFQTMVTLVGNGVEARTDELSGLRNRRAFLEAVERRIAAGHGLFAIVLIDLDRFKEVNDSLGHIAGDDLLREVGVRLKARMRQGDVLARLGGDEFAILLENTQAEAAREIAERLRLDLQQAFVKDGMTIYSDASCGVAVWPEAADDVGGLLQRADIAMYDAKRERSGTAIYTHGEDTDLSAPLRFVDELRTALLDDQLVLHYQPKIGLRTAKLEGVEALVRWKHPVRGLLPPDSFLPLAERYGLMRQLTTRVLTLALDQVSEWHRAGMDTSVAVNISVSNLLDLELPEQVRTLLEVRDLSPSCLILEVTETTLMADPTRATELLTRLQAIGVRVSIDDYGTGYSSLARLRELPVNELKLDRSFLLGISRDPRAGAIVRSTVELAHSLGLTLVAEGIETQRDEEILRELACDLGQGFHLARPLPADELLAWATQRGATAPRAEATPLP
ncbi:MAG: diguanylate cyclase [Frankiaceae bacterium]|nr:diguanylate cyclase [Frankiaceae bacterium]